MSRTVLITGANRGIGFGFVRSYLDAGWRVIATARNPAGAKDLLALKNDRLRVLPLDVSSDASVDEFRTWLGDLTSLDLLINNAGILRGEDQSFEHLNLNDIAETFNTNVLGVIRVTKALLAKLKAAPTAKVIQITSMMGSIADNRGGKYYAYRISKAALNMMNKSFAIDHPWVITAVLYPGWVQTDMGGASATTSIEDSVAGMTKVIAKLSPSDTGKFYAFDGKELPW